VGSPPGLYSRVVLNAVKVAGGSKRMPWLRLTDALKPTL
jgi:hypothetical protein